jgi:hypothetical protein
MSYEAALPAGRFRGRPSKFTPERVQQIQELVKSGVSCAEIAAFVGVTSGTLKVSCSRLRISLRRPRPIDGNRSPPSKAARSTKMATAYAAKFAVIVHYHGEERATELPLTTSMICRLALEASSRGLTISELAEKLVVAVTKQGLVQRVLEG